MDGSQALNPKTLAPSTNKLQQFVAEFERLQCLTTQPRGLPAEGAGPNKSLLNTLLGYRNVNLETRHDFVHEPSRQDPAEARQ
jgi:hypothetical protein